MAGRTYRIKIRRGLAAARPSLMPGEQWLDTDTGDLWIGTMTGNSKVGGSAPPAAADIPIAHAENGFAATTVQQALEETRLLAGYRAWMNAEMYRAIYRGIGAGRAVLVLRFDDNSDKAYTMVFPELTSRNLVACFPLNSSTLNVAGNLTTAQLLEMQKAGMQIVGHTRSHQATPASLAAFEDEVFGDKSAFEGLGITIDMFGPPGNWAGAYMPDSAGKMEMTPWRLVQDRFGALMGWLPLTRLPSLPVTTRWGLPHTLGETMTLAQLNTFVDSALRQGSRAELLFHPLNLDTAGYLSLADFRSLLDHIVALIPRGLRVLTPMASFYAAPGSVTENLLYDPSFELSGGGTWAGWSVEAGAPEITTGGRTGGNAVLVSSTDTVAQYFGVESYRSLRFTGYARALAGNSGPARVLVQYITGGSPLQDRTVTVTDSAWTKVEFTFQVPLLGGTNWRLILRSNTASRIIMWDDCCIERT